MKAEPELLTYGKYLRVPELLELQMPVGQPPVHDEMLFIILQQAQELWFKQILHDLRAVIGSLMEENLLEGARLLGRMSRVLDVLSREVEVMETLTPIEFQRFRGLLTPSSGFESEQFRELELASGLRTEAYLKVVSKMVNLERHMLRWPLSLHDAFLWTIRSAHEDPIEALISIYRDRDQFSRLYVLCEACSDYEMRFAEWRFQHVALVERVIGNRAPGTGGSSGTAYLYRTLQYRFFPELWEAHSRIFEGSIPPPS